MKESARVEERVTQIYTAKDFQHHLEQVVVHHLAGHCQALVCQHMSLNCLHCYAYGKIADEHAAEHMLGLCLQMHTVTSHSSRLML